MSSMGAGAGNYTRCVGACKGDAKIKLGQTSLKCDTGDGMQAIHYGSRHVGEGAHHAIRAAIAAVAAGGAS